MDVVRVGLVAQDARGGGRAAEEHILRVQLPVYLGDGSSGQVAGVGAGPRAPRHALKSQGPPPESRDQPGTPRVGPREAGLCRAVARLTRQGRSQRACSTESPVMRVHRIRYRPVPSGRTDASGLSSHTTARSAREGETWFGFGFGLGMG